MPNIVEVRIGIRITKMVFKIDDLPQHTSTRPNIEPNPLED